MLSVEDGREVVSYKSKNIKFVVLVIRNNWLYCIVSKTKTAIVINLDNDKPRARDSPLPCIFLLLNPIVSEKLEIRERLTFRNE